LETAPEPKRNNFEIVAYVDQSESMRGFLPEKDDAFFDGGSFEEFLRALTNQAELKRFVGFGTGEPGSGTDKGGEVRRDLGRVPPLDRDQSKLLNNNYAALIDELTAEANQSRISLIITDGVQSHSETAQGSAMGSTAAAAKRWLATGGTIEARILTSPMKGKYFSEDLRAAGKPYGFNIAEAKRPFLVLAFIPSAELLDDWDGLLRRERLSPLDWKATYRLPQYQTVDPPEVTVIDRQFDAAESKNLGMIEQDNVPVSRSRRLPQLHDQNQWRENVFAAAVDEALLMDSTGKEIAEIPLSFSIRGVSSTLADPDEWLKAFRELKPRLAIYAKSISADGTTETWKPVDGGIYDLRYVDPIVEVKGMAPEPDGDLPQAMVTYMVPWTNGKIRLGVMSLEQATQKVDPPSFSAWSTINDSTPAEMQKIYNLQTLLEQIAGDSSKLIRKGGSVFCLYPN
jgi:hypothetical protein